MVDVGGESTRPGTPSVEEREELVVRGLAAEDVMVSGDTMRANIARQAAEAGVALVNEFRRGLADPAAIAPERPVVDPGLGLAKEAQYDVDLMAGVAELRTLGQPVLIGGSANGSLGTSSRTRTRTEHHHRPTAGTRQQPTCQPSLHTKAPGGPSSRRTSNAVTRSGSPARSLVRPAESRIRVVSAHGIPGAPGTDACQSDEGEAPTDVRHSREQG
ncbi:dihydropteroate synthase [Streptomyces virginiae]|uniref:dihydropteroate synthase n=1 Tax=Streptomyces virginiae TaxID=1961 RepID=UPI003823CA58